MPPLMPVAELRTNSGNRQTILEITAAREVRLSRMLIAYIAMGLFFMVLPGTFLGVWNLIAISNHRSAEAVSAAWIQAHGHAQIFGWIGSFILGIGYYSIPKLRRMKSCALWAPWTSLVMWCSDVTLRWTAGVYEWHWRSLLPLSAGLEIAAFLIFFRMNGRNGSAIVNPRSCARKTSARLDHTTLGIQNRGPETNIRRFCSLSSRVPLLQHL